MAGNDTSTTPKIGCATSSTISTALTIGYGIIYASILLIVSVYSFNLLTRHDSKFQHAHFSKKIRIWAVDLWKRRRCYLPILTHLFDQVTDISVAAQFLDLALTKQCGELNMWYLFIITIGSMVVYRVISAFLIYQSSNRSLQRFLLQLADLELFRALYVNYLCDKVEPCDPQRWITAMEASLESTPQALVQMIYLVKTDTFTSSWLVTVSLLSSIWSIISKLVSDDKIIVVNAAKRVHFKRASVPVVLGDLCIIILSPISAVVAFVFAIVVSIVCCPCCLVCIYYGCVQGLSNTGDESEYEEDSQVSQESKDYELDLPRIGSHNSATPQVEKEKSRMLWAEGHFEWMSMLFALRFVWRVLDVSSIIFVRCLCWIIVGGTVLTAIISIEAIGFMTICATQKRWDWLFGIVALVAITDGMYFV